MEENRRYSRHYQLAGFGKQAQEKLGRSKVLVIGAGGLGCPALQYLVASGIGQVGVADHDTIQIDNLQRQVLYNTDEIGLFKAEVAAEKLRVLNPEIQICEYVMKVSAENAAELIWGYDMVLDCSDNFPTRYLLSDVCRLLDKPLVFGAVFQYEGQLAVFNVAGQNGVKTTYRHLFPDPPGRLEAPDCSTAGVLGVLPGTIGTFQAVETIKILTGIGQPLCNKLMTISLLDYTTMILDISPTVTGGPESFTEFEQMDYEDFCSTKPSPGIRAIGRSELMDGVLDKDVLIIDVRNPDEQPRLSCPHISIPLPGLAESLDLIERKNLVMVCQSGKRSLAAAGFLYEKLGKTHRISHLEGGIATLGNL